MYVQDRAKLLFSVMEGHAHPQIVIYIGIALSVVPAITLLFFDDDKFLKEDEEDTAVKDETSTGASCAWPLLLARAHGNKRIKVIPDDNRRLSLRCSSSSLSTACDAVPSDEEAPPSGGVSAHATKGWVTVRHVPYILAAHDCISGIASGMTTKCAHAAEQQHLVSQSRPRAIRSLP